MTSTANASNNGYNNIDSNDNFNRSGGNSK